ncbi:MAG: hypothetical protein L0H75_08200 [Nitrosospira sp.]|nr:hypothetical protein [Nitrosospira sp.]
MPTSTRTYNPENVLTSKKPSEPLDPFEVALHNIAARVNATAVDEVGTPISRFKAVYSAVLDRVNAGQVKIVRRGRQRYILLGEEQAQALVSPTADIRTLFEAFEGLPKLSAETPRLRVTSVSEAEDQYRLVR